jgi:uncharacterized repeat protein (TIGR01451 family)
MMKKEATLNPGRSAFRNNGIYPNPVSILFGDTVRYKITAVNASLTSGAMTIRDTLPLYLQYVSSSLYVKGVSGSNVSWTTTGTPPREVLLWTSPSVASLDSVTVCYEVTPEKGVSASQPMYINYAWVQLRDTLLTTNKTYHQGVGISVVTFSALFGGSIYNANEQALDYRTSPRSGILVAPDEGYRFVGWKHDGYVSLRGESVKADSGIIHYEDIVIYGSVELRAVFEPDEKDNLKINRTIEEINRAIKETDKPSIEDRIWSSENTLYVRTNKSGSIVRIYRPDGTLYEQQTVITEGMTEIRLSQGIYVVTLNNGIGQKVVIR